MSKRNVEGGPLRGDESASVSEFDQHHCDDESVSISNTGPKYDTTVLEHLVQESLAASMKLGARFSKQEAALSEVLRLLAAKEGEDTLYNAGEDPTASSASPCPPNIGDLPRRPSHSPLGMMESPWLPADSSSTATSMEPTQAQEALLPELRDGFPEHPRADSQARKQACVARVQQYPSLIQQRSRALAQTKPTLRPSIQTEELSTHTLPGSTNNPCPQDHALQADNIRGCRYSFQDGGFGSGADGNGGEVVLGSRGRSTIREIRRVRRSTGSTSSLASLPGSLKASGPKFIRSDTFDYLMGFVLALNAIVTGVQANGMASRTPDPKFLYAFETLDWVFAGIFSVELLLRIMTYGREFFSKADWKWNLFDVIIVLFQIIELIAKHFASGSAVSNAIDNFGILRLLRMGRLARLVRMVRLIPELKSMVYLVLASLGSFVWAALLMFLIIYAFAIYFTEMAVDVRQYATTSSQQEVVYEQWGSIGHSIFSLFMSISGGADWQSFIDVFSYSRNVWSIVNTFVFSLYIAFFTLVMLNLVTGVFVEGAHRIVQKERDKDILKMASRAFVFADSDESLDISWDEFQDALDSPPMLAYLEAVCMTTNEASQLFCILDTDKNRSLSVDEFVKGCQRLSAHARCLDVAQLKQSHDEQLEGLKTQINSMHRTLHNLLELQRLATLH